ncbi:MAG: SLBB domain-containing protein [Candidatus Kapabacteria bacterium]|nr:SLBB domain-containing protein [Candidatus Kapabacteria bacterium]
MAIFFISASGILTAQDENYIDNRFLTGAKKGEIDSLGGKTAKEIADETAGLMEREIDPAEYILGPNDILTVSVLSTKYKTSKCVVSPDGKMLIPEIGVVNLKGKTLADAEIIISKRAARIYKSYVEVFVVLKKLRMFKVTVSGAVSRPAIVPATAVDRVSEIIERAGGLQYDASIRSITLLRAATGENVPVDLVRFNYIGEKDANPTVLGGDHVIIPPSNDVNSIEIRGEVPSPGLFEFVEGDSLSTLIKFAHGFLASSFLDSVEVVRGMSTGGTSGRWFININSWRGNLNNHTALTGDFRLQSGDRIYIRRIRDWLVPKSVAVKGQVNFQGKYPLNEDNLRVSDILKRAGGLNDKGSLEGAILIRQEEMTKIDRELERLKKTSLSEMSENERRYFQARINEQKGVMAIDFRKIMDDESSDDNIVLINKDSIFVPQKKLFINVQGRVNNPGLVVYKKGYTYLDYIQLAGGYGSRADDGETMIVKKRGELYLAEDMNYILEPGDNILVPPVKELSFGEIFMQSLTIAAQFVTIIGVVIAIMAQSK